MGLGKKPPWAMGGKAVMAKVDMLVVRLVT